MDYIHLNNYVYKAVQCGLSFIIDKMLGRKNASIPSPLMRNNRVRIQKSVFVIK